MTHIKIPLAPVSASRPRVSKQGWTYYVDPYKSYKAALHGWLKKNYAGPVMAGVLTVMIEIVAARPKTTKLVMPKPDVDNYAKATLDGMNKVVFLDDSQIYELIVRKRWTTPGEEPHTSVSIEE